MFCSFSINYPQHYRYKKMKKEIIYKSKFQTVEFYPELAIVEATWTPSTEKMSNEEYKQEMLSYLERIKAYQPKFALPNTTELRFAISPEIQDWMNQHIFTGFLELGMQAAAFVVSADLFAQVSIEQTMEEDMGISFKTRYFEDREAALDWLQSLA